MDPAAPIYLCGPTASGKSSLAIDLAKRLGGEIVNADAFQLYRGLETLTAAPAADELEAVPHHLYGVLDPLENCDAMRFRELALPVLDEILSRGAIPIVTGGSGLYLKFLTHGPSPLPSGDPELRRELAMLSMDELSRRLQSLDPVEAGLTDLKNRRYLTRALEICLLSGKPCSELRDRWETITSGIAAKLRGIFIQRQRPDLHARIEARTGRMLDEGAIEEVRSLPEVSINLGKAIGYREVLDLIAGTSDRRECADRIRNATRQYAKRQETWFRRESWLRPLTWPPGSPAPVDRAVELLEK